MPSPRRARPLRSRRLGGAALFAASLAALALGMIGFFVADRALAHPPRLGLWYVIDLLYRSVQLFVLQMSPVVGEIPFSLEMARWLAGTVAGVTLWKAAAQIFRQQWTDRRLRRTAGHVIVCGLGTKGFELVQQLVLRGDDVIVIEIDEGDDELATCREMGVTVLIGDATSEHLLRKAGVERAGRLIAVCREDSTNIEIALAARELMQASGRSLEDPLCCHVHIIDLKLAELFRRHKVFSSTTDPFDARIFSFYENSARELLARYPLEVRTAAEGSGPVQAVHLVVVGLRHMGEAVALQAARIAHLASFQPLRLTIVDPEAEERRMNMLARYGALDQVCRLHFESQSLEHPDVRHRLETWAAEPGYRLVVVICIDDDARALSLALNLPPALADRGVPVYVRQSEQRGLAALIDERRSDSPIAVRVNSFGEPEVAAGLEEVLQEKLDLLARAIHERYLAQRKMEMAGAPLPDDRALRPWTQLDADLKSSNRQQADHIDVKIRAAGCRRVPATVAADLSNATAGATGSGGSSPASPFNGFTNEEVELLAKMEHTRWHAEKLLSGWRHGETKDDQRKTTPFLVPWEDLAEKLKERNRQFARQIPEILALVGEKIVR